jgi:hypothetical protein
MPNPRPNCRHSPPKPDTLDLALSAMEAAGWPVGQRSYTMGVLERLERLGFKLIPPAGAEQIEE